MSAVSAEPSGRSGPPTFSFAAAEAFERWRCVAAFVLFATLLVIVGPRHEAWFDESQAWLLARDSTLWDLLVHRLPYEGTPALWHGLLWALSHAGMPYAWLWLVSSAFACAGAWIILTCAPFPFWLRLGVIFSYFVAYQYPIVARGYALDLLLIPLLAAAFAERLRRPLLYGLLLGVCANINAFSFIIAAVLFGEFVVAAWRGGPWRRALPGCAVYIVLACVAFVQAWPPPDSSFAAETSFVAGRASLVISEAFIDRWDIFSSAPPTEFAMKAGFILSMLLLAPSMLLYRRAGIALLVAALFLGLLAFSGVKYANAWHGGLIFLIWIFGLWIGWHALDQLSAAQRRITIASIVAIVSVNVMYTASASLREVREPYSAGPAAARVLERIRQAQPDASIGAAGFKTFAVQPWFNANAFANYRNGAPEIAYYAWRSGERFQKDVTPQHWEAMVSSNTYGVLLLSIHELPAETIARYASIAREGGYCHAAGLEGGLIWKSYVLQSDAMLIFSRCGGG